MNYTFLHVFLIVILIKPSNATTTFSWLLPWPPNQWRHHLVHLSSSLLLVPSPSWPPPPLPMFFYCHCIANLLPSSYHAHHYPHATNLCHCRHCAFIPSLPMTAFWFQYCSVIYSTFLISGIVKGEPCISVEIKVFPSLLISSFHFISSEYQFIFFFTNFLFYSSPYWLHLFFWEAAQMWISSIFKIHSWRKCY